MQYVYTRSIADPQFGVRATHRGDRTDATAWVVRDDAGSTVFVPGPFGAATRELPKTDIALLRARWNLPRLGLALDASNREGKDYSNRVFGVDAAWLPTGSDNVLVQWLGSETHDPAAGVLDSATGGAWRVEWNHGSARLPWLLRHEHIDRGFRADNGYMPAADVDENYAKIGPRFFDTGMFNELQPFVEVDEQRVATTGATTGATISRSVAPGVYFQAPRNTFGTVTWHYDDAVRATADSPLRHTNFLRFDATTCPTARWARIRLFGDVGELMDFGSGEVATGHALGAELRVRPNDRVEIFATLTHEALNGEGETRRGRTREAATLLYYLSTASSWRLEWQQHGASLVFSHRPSWRQSVFVGVSTVGRAGHDEGRLFLKWSRTFGE
jgi:hypothetical protein